MKGKITMADLRIPDLNKVLIAGRLGHSPDLKYLPSGMAVCNLSLAATRYYRNKAGEKCEETTWIDVKCWDKTAEMVAESTGKGRAVIVEGSLKEERWTGRDGEEKKKIVINAQRIAPLDWPADDEATVPGYSPSPGLPLADNLTPDPPPVPGPDEDIPF